jgi:F-type H+-transporting ATPase subunit b
VQIDWFTLIAQIVNFLILLWLLQRFLYGPIMSTMQAREEKLESQFDAAEAKSREAEEERTQLQAERADLADRREELLQEARAEAAERRKQLIQDAREETEGLMARWYDAIEREKQAFLREVQTRMGQQVLALMRRALVDLSGHELEHAIVQKFVERAEAELTDPDGSGDAKGEQAARSDASAAGNGKRAVVRTSFELPKELQKQVRGALAPLLEDAAAEANGASGNDETGNDEKGPSGHPSITFERAESLICGIEAEIQNRRIAWSIRDYLDRLEKDLDEAILQNGLSQAQRRRETFGDNGIDEILPG